MDEATFLEKMDKYLDGQIFGAELEDFKSMIQDDPDKKTLLQEQKIIRQNLTELGRSDLADKLASLKEDVINDNTLQTNDDSQESLFYRLKRFIPLTAAASVIFILGMFYFTQDGDRTNRKLVSNNQELAGTGTKMIWEGEIKLSIIPEEGKFGSGNMQSMQTSVYKSQDEYYELEGNSLKIFLDEDEFPLDKNLQLKGEELIITTKTRKSLFKKNYKITN